MKKYSVFIQIIIKLLRLELNFPADRNKGNTGWFEFHNEIEDLLFSFTFLFKKQFPFAAIKLIKKQKDQKNKVFISLNSERVILKVSVSNISLLNPWYIHGCFCFNSIIPFSNYMLIFNFSKNLCGGAQNKKNCQNFFNNCCILNWRNYSASNICICATIFNVWSTGIFFFTGINL